MASTTPTQKNEKAARSSGLSKSRALPAASPSQDILPEIIQRAIEDPQTLTPEIMRTLQRTHGNGFVSRLVQRQKGSGMEEWYKSAYEDADEDEWSLEKMPTRSRSGGPSSGEPQTEVDPTRPEQAPEQGRARAGGISVEKEKQIDQTAAFGVEGLEGFLGSKAKDIEDLSGKKIEQELNDNRDAFLRPDIPEDLRKAAQSIPPKQVVEYLDKSQPGQQIQEPAPMQLPPLRSAAKEPAPMQLPPLRPAAKEPAPMQLPPLRPAAGAAEQAAEKPEADPAKLREDMLGLMSETAGLLGNIGTGAKGNSGLGPDLKKEDNFLADMFKVGEKAQGTEDEDRVNAQLGQLSGASDIAGGGVNAITLLYETRELVARLRKIEKLLASTGSEEEKQALQREASIIQTKIYQSYMGFQQSLFATFGGAMTLVENSASNVQSKSALGFDQEGGNALSTDFKLGGDIAGALGSTFGSAASGMTFGSKIASGDLTKGTKTEAAGRVALESSKLLKSVGGAGKAGYEVAAQIGGGGQIVAEGSKAALGVVGKSMGGLGIGIAGMDAIRQGYLINKFRERKEALKAAAVGDLLKDNHAEALAFIQDILSKRQARAAKEIFFDSLNIIAGVLVATGVGAAFGLVLGAASATLQLGHTAFKYIRQKLRDSAAEERDKDPEKKGKTYAKWKEGKESIKGGWEGFKASWDVLVTPNWDKSSENKAAEYARNAQSVLDMVEGDQDQQPGGLSATVLRGLGMARDEKSLAEFKAKKKEDKLAAIVEAMKKR